MKREQSCCFTGHRPDKLPWGENESDPRCLALKRRLEGELTQVYNRGYRHFICGMARGCDLYFCEAVLELRSRYFRLMEQCDFETMVQHRYTSGCMQRRDRYMVDHAGLLIAAYDGMTLGGTMYTLTYAMRQGLETLILDIERK